MVFGDAQAGSGGMWGGRWGGAESRAPGDPVGQALGVSPVLRGSGSTGKKLGKRSVWVPGLRTVCTTLSRHLPFVLARLWPAALHRLSACSPACTLPLLSAVARALSPYGLMGSFLFLPHWGPR